MTVSKDDPRPSYVQIADAIRRAIDAGEYAAGQRLPSGRDLAKKFGVALNTAQHAVELLKTEGLLVSHPPRGVFVSAAGESAPQTPTATYTEVMRHLDDLESSFHDAVGEIDRRLTDLEQAVRRSTETRKTET